MDAIELTIKSDKNQKILIDIKDNKIKYLVDKESLTIIDTKTNKIKHLISKDKIKASNN